ncbi:hypothetical protein HRI_000610100 [Hibiscus trionum]|uniref:HMA domain-containing protein n=1 Tax=Hibiscus trionum TaxID=183268 RepID=A0A9W7LLS1_HIBTR|nr:hypothetical protein HRI_000610100 [Hibiscus trionum]
MAAKAADEDAVGGALKYKTWVFKVFIHCEGCRKKVKKVLQAIDGVYETKIDSQQHKVTVTSSVDAETLIKKLTKLGKHVELWPESKPEKKDKKPGKTNNNEKQKDGGEEAGGGDKHDPKINNSAEKPKPAASKNGGAGAAAAKGSARDNQHQAGDQMGGKSEEPHHPQSTNGASNGGNKKKKNKGQKGNPGGPNSETQPGGDIQSATALPVLARPEASIDLIPPNQPMYPYTPLLYGSPFCGVSYNTTCPSSTSSYYAPTMRYVPPAPPSYPNDKFSEDYYYDDDESGCSIM